MDVCGDIENREMNSVLIKSEPLEDTQDKETTEETNVILITRFYILLLFLLAHLWGAYAIPVALSGVRRPSFVVRRTSCVVCVHHNYQK